MPVIVLHPSVGWQSVGPDRSQRLGEAVGFLSLSWSWSVVEHGESSPAIRVMLKSVSA